MRRLFDSAEAAFGGGDVLVNNAGIMENATLADIAQAVSFLVGPQGGWINGQVLRANGGVI